MKKLLTAISIILIILLLSFPAMAENDVDWSMNRQTITIGSIDSDWDYASVFPGPKYEDGIRINYIRFNPEATGDICSIEDSDAGNVKHFLVNIADGYDDRIQYYTGARLKLYLDFNDTNATWTASYAAGCSITIQLWHTQEDD